MSDTESTIIPTNRNKKLIDIMSAVQNKPPELDFIWPGFLASTVGVLVAPGATGKSFWALEAAMSVACGVPGGDLVELSPTKTGRVAYLAGEDPEPALIWRIHHIGKHLSPDALSEINKNLAIEPITGECRDVMDDRQLEQMIADYTGYRLIVLDTLSRMHRRDENSNGEMAQVVGRFERLAVKTGASVLYLHHVNKNSAREGQTDQQQAGRGASALVDNPRWCGYVARMSKKEAEHLSDHYFEHLPIKERRKQFVRFGVSKQNYGEDLPDRWYKREDGGVLVPAELTGTDTEKASRAIRLGMNLTGGDNDRW